MRVSDADILFVSGENRVDAGHWLERWRGRLPTGRRVSVSGPPGWPDALLGMIAAAERPVILIGHGEGVAVIVEAVSGLPEGAVRGAFLVAPPGRDLARSPLPFPSLLVASRSDPACTYQHAEDLAYAWDAALIDAGEAGRLDAVSGHGPWPEGLMRLGGFLSRL